MTENQHPPTPDGAHAAPTARPARATAAPGSRRTRRRWARWGLLGAGLAAVALGSACDAHVANDVLSVVGLEGPETIALRLHPGDSSVLDIDWNNDGSAEFTFARDTFSQITVDGLGGDDTITIDQSNGAFTDTEITTLIGGGGNDTLTGGAGAETLDGGPGADTLDGNQGADTLLGGDGTDQLRWDPGDGSDVVHGGADADRLAFNGSNIGEVFTVSTSGTEARLTRNVANIVMDLDGVEDLDLRALGGVDVLQVSDVSTTDLATVTTDFAATGGVDDASLDEVLVPAGTTIGQDGTAGTVDGLGAQVRVIGGSPTDRIHVTGTEAVEVESVLGTGAADAVTVTASGTDVVVTGATPGVHALLSSVDRVDVDLGGGADSFSATGNLAALTTLDVDGGSGADTILGGNGVDVLAGGADADFLDGNQGDDAVAGGPGTDVVQWDPGDGNDTIDGGADADRMAFNGSNIAEIFAFSAVGDRVRFTRNIALITLDLDGIETFDLAALGGADVLQMASVAGTDLTTITTNFAGFGGVDDAQIDEVVVPPGLPIGQDGIAATVDGFGAQVRVVGGFPTDRIHVTGTAAVDVVPLVGTTGADTVDTVANGTDVSVFGATPGLPVLLTTIERLDVDLGGGDDRFTATGNLAPLVALDVDGGSGSDTILGGNGADLLAGGADADFLDGNQGIDLVVAGAGADVVQWDPGDGSDTIDGGGDADRMAFNGSNIAELFALSAVGDHVRFTRNIGAITLDLDGIETFDLTALGGADVLQVDNLAGTDLTTVDADLAATFGGTSPDGIGDQVIVNGTGGADTVAVGASGSTVEVAGLAALVRIAVTDPTLDRLTVNGLAGADTITATPAAGALILLDLLP